MNKSNTSIAGRLTVRNKKTSKEEKMVIMPLSLLNSMMTGLEKSEYRTLIYILSNSRYGKNCSVTLPHSIRTLASIIDLSPSSVSKALNDLESKGFIKVNKEDMKTTYILCCPKNEEEDEGDYMITLK